MRSEDFTSSPLYSPDMAPVPPENRTWHTWNLAALWVGMAVCIPTYLLASYMIRSGLSWQAALIIIGLANLVITLPMVLNGHPGVKYGIPFPVVGRSVFGTNGIHIVAIIRAIVACGWFGVQTWVGGLAMYSIWNAATGNVDAPGLNFGEFVCFGLFWLLNMYFIWKGTDSIKWLEDFSAPILILIGMILIYWGYQNVGSFSQVLEQGKQLQQKTAKLTQSENRDVLRMELAQLKDLTGKSKADSVGIWIRKTGNEEVVIWQSLESTNHFEFGGKELAGIVPGIQEGTAPVQIQFKKGKIRSNRMDVFLEKGENQGRSFWEYILWFTTMVGFWATMSISISDITRFAKSQKDQLAGQFIGLPGTMLFYSFVGIFVTCAAIVAFPDVLISEDAPWDPVSLVSKFDSPVVIIFAQLAMIIATLSTNIAANVIAPANAFSNLSPKRISFQSGGFLAGILGIIICPWWLMNEISGILIFVSGLLGPVLGILICDYFIIRKKQISIPDLYKVSGMYAFGGSGFNSKALIALTLGVLVALVGYWIPALDFLYKLSWFTGFSVAFGVYWIISANVERQFPDL